MLFLLINSSKSKWVIMRAPCNSPKLVTYFNFFLPFEKINVLMIHDFAFIKTKNFRKTSRKSFSPSNILIIKWMVGVFSIYIATGLSESSSSLRMYLNMKIFCLFSSHVNKHHCDIETFKRLLAWNCMPLHCHMIKDSK